MKTTINSFATTLLGLSLTAIVSYPTAAEAASKRLAPSAFCHPERTNIELFGSTLDTVERIGPQLRNVWGENTLICGYPSDGSLLHNQVELIKIRGYRGNSGNFLDSTARACVGSFSGTEHCGYSTVLKDGSGNFTIEIDDLSKWGNSHWYPYIKLVLQTGDRLFGIVITD